MRGLSQQLQVLQPFAVPLLPRPHLPHRICRQVSGIHLVCIPRLQVSRLSSPRRGSQACRVSAPGGLSSWYWVRAPAPQGLCTCLPSWPGLLGALETVAQVSGDVFLTLNLDQGLEKLAPNTVLSVQPAGTRPHPSPRPSLCYSI